MSDPQDVLPLDLCRWLSERGVDADAQADIIRYAQADLRERLDEAEGLLTETLEAWEVGHDLPAGLGDTIRAFLSLDPTTIREQARDEILGEGETDAT